RDDSVATHADGLIGANRNLLVVPDALRAIALDGGLLVVVDLLRAIVTNPVGLILLDLNVLISLRVNEQLFRAFLILEANFVEVRRVTPPARSSLGSGLRHVRRQCVRRHVLGVVHAPGNDGLVRIALDKIDNHLLADAGNGDHSPVLAGPRVGYAHPPGAVLVVLAVAIPGELDLHAAVLIGVDLIVPGTGHYRGLRARDLRLGRRAGGTELLLGGDGAEGAVV